MTYGDYSFSPVPLVNISKNYNRTTGGFKLGSTLIMSLEGTLTPHPTGEAGVVNVMPYVDQLREALSQDGCPFVIDCGGTVLWSGHPMVGLLSFNRTPDNWVDRVDFTVDLTFDEEPEGSGEDNLAPPYIQSVTESLSWEFFTTNSVFSWNIPTVGVDANTFMFQSNWNISAQGRTHYEGCETANKQAWEYARDYVLDRLASGTSITTSGVLNFNPNDYTNYNNVRTQVADERGGSFSMTQTTLALNPSASGVPGSGIESFTVNVQKSTDTDMTSVVVDGSIEGVETITYGSDPGDLSISEADTKYARASGYWNVVKDRLYYRAQLVHADAVVDKAIARNLNIVPLRSGEGHSPPAGRITYSYTYDDRPSTCITGVLSETINIDDTHPTDVFAEVAVLGRRLGPVLQDVGTITTSQRSVSIDTISPPSTLCTAVGLRDTQGIKVQVAELLCNFQADLTDVYNQVFKTRDDEHWEPKTGRYSRRVAWTYQDCSITGDTSICTGG
jgi:hypothetical protein